jgi:hypothetical protein
MLEHLAAPKQLQPLERSPQHRLGSLKKNKKKSGMTIELNKAIHRNERALHLKTKRGVLTKKVLHAK